MTIVAIHIDQRGFDCMDPDEADMAILDVETDTAVTYSIEVMFDIDPGGWRLAWVSIDDGLIGINEMLDNIDVPLDYLDDASNHFIEEMLNAPVVSWVWE